MYFLCLRAPNAWIIFGKNSFPEPLSPVTSTERSMGATFTARSMAASSACEFPMMENRCLAVCTSRSWLAGAGIVLLFLGIALQFYLMAFSE